MEKRDAHGYLALVLHAHLPFVRHPEHEFFLEENWLFEAITETYVPLLLVFQGWERDGLPARLALTLSPTLCSMLRDPLLQTRYRRHLDQLIDLADKEAHRTALEPAFHELAVFYHERFQAIRETFAACQNDLVRAFRQLQDAGRIEIITTAATHAILPLVSHHPPALRGQILVARDDYRTCFGREPEGFWLPECAYADRIEGVLREASIQWFVTETHGLLNASPRPRYGMFAPVLTPLGLAAFGRDHESARQVWSRHEGYPGDPRYRDFYRDIGFDLDLDYVRPYLMPPDKRSFTGLKYHRITGPTPEKLPYEPKAAREAVEEHARHFLHARAAQIRRLDTIMDRPPIVVAPYDAELFGHWWYEGPEFLDVMVRKACKEEPGLKLVTPGDYLRLHPTQQVARPAASSWGEEGYLRVWLNEQNEWVYRHAQAAELRMTELARHNSGSAEALTPLRQRALRQAGRELLLAQASDWSFILKSGTSSEYAARRVKDHLQRFTRLYEDILRDRVGAAWLDEVESRDNIFPNLEYRYWQ